MIKLAPSILAADFSNLEKDVRLVDEAGADLIHIDVMDGMFVPNISFGIPIIKSIRDKTNKIFDVHLMIEEPSRYIEDFVKSGANSITVHVESCKHLHRTIQLIKSFGVKASVALNPATPLNSLDYVLEDLDMVLLMTVNPGYGGQTFIPQSLKKISDLKKIIEKHKYKIDLQVDGGIHLENVEQIIQAGANVIVTGSAVFKEDIDHQVKAFKTIFNKLEG